MTRDDEGSSDGRGARDEGLLPPDQELGIVRRALAAGDLPHAARHLASALAVDPTSVDALGLAGQLLAVAPDPLAITGGDTEVGMSALRALALHGTGDLDEAVALLLAVIATCPEIPFTAWLERWLGDGVADQLDPGDVHVAVEDALRRLEGSEHPEAALPALLELITRVRDRHPDHERLAGSHARALRRAGRPGDAVAVARASDERAPTYFTGVILASSLRDAGDLEGSLAVFRDLAARYPEEEAVHLDIGDLLLDLDRPADASASYQLVLERLPHHEWAEPSALYARYLESRDGAWRDRLEDLAEMQEAGRARQLADAVTPYLGYLPGRPEALIQLAAQILETDTAGEVEVSLSSLEAPSAARVLDTIVGERGGSLRLMAEIPEPDPRQPRRPVPFVLWRHDGAIAVPALPPPRSSVIEPLIELAASPYHAAAWAEHARILGRELGASAVEEILAATLHVTHAPEGWSPWDWTVHVQVAAAMTLAFVDDGWHESARQAALTSLVYGPVDWTSVAGLIALTRLACLEPDRVPDVEPILEGAASHPSTPVHHMCLIEPAVQLMLQLPDLSLPIKRARRARRAELEAEAAE